jgi:hypothetical protein
MPPFSVLAWQAALKSDNDPRNYPKHHEATQNAAFIGVIS